MDHTYFISIMKVEQDKNNLAIINVNCTILSVRGCTCFKFQLSKQRLLIIPNNYEMQHVYLSTVCLSNYESRKLLKM